MTRTVNLENCDLEAAAKGVKVSALGLNKVIAT